MADSPVCNEDHILKIEAQEAVREVAFAVKSVEMSKSLPVTAELVYLNLRTKEDVLYCVELSISGFRVCIKVLALFLELIWLCIYALHGPKKTHMYALQLFIVINHRDVIYLLFSNLS